MYIILNDELYHHGVKGQKWGIRRYQNYDGSYTKAGLKRYYAAKEKYDKAEDRVKRAKESGSKTELTNARIEMKRAKRELNKHYKHLKQDKLADQGKELYSKGKTITGNNDLTRTLAAISAGLLTINKDEVLKRLGVNSDISENKKLKKILTAAVASTGVAVSAKGLKDYHDNKRLRAYYSHTSNY